jgi:hypothetical protein
VLKTLQRRPSRGTSDAQTSERLWDLGTEITDEMISQQRVEFMEEKIEIR